MAGAIHDGDDDVIAEINIIPFVDIVLVLLIIFMLTSAAIVRASIQVDLPFVGAVPFSRTGTVDFNRGQ